MWAVFSQRNLIKRWPLSYKARIWEKAIHWYRIFEIERRRIESKAKNEMKKGRGNRPNATIALSEEEIDIFFETKKRTGEQVLHNRYWTLCGSLIVSEVAQNNEIYVGAMLFWRLTVKAKIYIFIQRGKLRADRAKTHGMLDLWNRECMKIKSQCEIFPFVLLNLWTSYENRDTVEFVGRSKYCLEISKTWERLACSSLLRSSSAAMKIEMAGIYWPQANAGNSSWYWGEVKLLTFLRGSLWRLSFGHETLNGCFALQG